MNNRLLLLVLLACSGLQAADAGKQGPPLPDDLAVEPVDEPVDWSDFDGASLVVEKLLAERLDGRTRGVKRGRVVLVPQAGDDSAQSEGEDQKSSERHSKVRFKRDYSYLYNGQIIDSNIKPDRRARVKCLDAACKEEFGSLNLLEQHLRRVHQASHFIKCNSCESVYSARSAVSDHFRIAHAPRLVNWKKCGLEGCNYKNVQKSNVWAHMVGATHVKVGELGARSSCPMPGCQFKTNPLRDESFRRIIRSEVSMHLREEHKDAILYLK